MVPPEMSSLVWAVGLPDNKSGTVLEALQDIIAYCKSMNLPVLRFHSDKSMEFFAHSTRRWLKSQGLRMTSSEGGVPETNGAAERTVRWVKQRARVLLHGARLPPDLWPYAASTAAVQQRARALGFEAQLAAPFGSRVHVRQKAYDEKGTVLRPDNLRVQWLEGRYLGLSDVLSRGHLIYVEGEKSMFFHTLHVRPHLVDPGPPEEEFAVDLVPRRIRRKRPPDAVMAELALGLSTKGDASSDFSRAASLLLEACGRLREDQPRYRGVLATKKEIWVQGLEEDERWLTQLMVAMMAQAFPDGKFATIGFSDDVDGESHLMDIQDVGDEVYVLPLKMPKDGGHLWIELWEGDVVTGSISRVVDRHGVGHFGCGCVHRLKEHVPFSFNPRRRHYTTPWEGKRTLLSAYSSGAEDFISEGDRKKLEDNGFPTYSIKENYYPKVHMMKINSGIDRELVNEFEGTEHGNVGEHSRTVNITVELDEDERFTRFSSAFCDVLFVVSPDGQAEMEEDMKVMVRSCMLDGGGASMKKNEVTFTRNVEGLLEELQAPLAIVHTVHPGEVEQYFERWRKVIIKEIDAIAHATVILPEGSELRQEWLAKEGRQVLPMKLVYTVKPPAANEDGEYEAWFKRKARIVICGNLAEEDTVCMLAPPLRKLYELDWSTQASMVGWRECWTSRQLSCRRRWTRWKEPPLSLRFLLKYLRDMALYLLGACGAYHMLCTAYASRRVCGVRTGILQWRTWRSTWMSGLAA